MIVAEHVSKKYQRGKTSFYAVSDLSIVIEDGENFVSFVGESGSGKTTLFNILGCLDCPTAGSVAIDGEDVYQLSHPDRARLRNAKIGYIFQSFFLDDTYSVRANVELPLIIGGMRKSERARRVRMVLDDVGLGDKRDARVTELSGGERQRVSIARAIANEPSIVLADEPCGNLDSANGDRIMGILRGIAESGRTVLLITHNRDHASYAKRVITLKDGKIAADAHS
jgi:putative ABC transport system ATP-binding protein